MTNNTVGAKAVSSAGCLFHWKKRTYFS